ncbi:XdhC family protein [Kitasatospora sp. NPDC056181]|uniref:XdhC family protein n=1 Tax=Kitasatospora sp. NPDC056181 TaxID=3345737 RepID=UPI0035DFC88F
MSAGLAVEQRMAELTRSRVPFVKATVVRALHPTSAQPGDTALVLEDGRIEGFVGGVCAEATVRVQALRLLRTGESLLLRISPGAPAQPQEEGEAGTLLVANPCLSGGELEIFLEPLRPDPVVLVLGDTPIGRSLVALGAGLEYDIRTAAEEVTAEELADVAAVVIASHGRQEEGLLTRAARADVPYVALVASRRRGATVLGGLDLSAEQRDRIHTPAGLWIGARTPGEIAVSILAELVASRHALSVHTEETTAEPAPPSAEPRTALDPVCGMTVAVVADTPYSDARGHRHWFCSTGCRDRFEAETAQPAEAL